MTVTSAPFLMRGRSISYTSASTHTRSSSPMVKSSTVAPPEYWPWTSSPGLAPRMITSPSMGDGSTYSWVTASSPALRSSLALRSARSISAFAFR